MNNTQKKLKVLFIGESWHIHMIHSKGYDSFTSSKYEEGHMVTGMPEERRR